MNIFSFKGRARRTEWWLISLPAMFVYYNYFRRFSKSAGEQSEVLSVILMVLWPIVIWLKIAVNTRRCHDLGHNGFWQLIPFYGIWMGFVKGEARANKYGEEVIQE